MKGSTLISLSLAAFATMAMLSGCGNSANPLALDPALDTTPPPAPTSMIVSHDAAGREVLTWDASAAPDVVGYQVYLYSPSTERDNAYVLADDPNPSDNSFPLPTVDSTTEVVYRVRAVDAAGNASAFSAPAMITINGAGGGGGGDHTAIDIP